MTEFIQHRLENKSSLPSGSLCELTVKNFRCFAHKEIVFSKRCAIIFGSNGAGKSSLLEAIYFLTYAHSFRTRSPREIIKAGGQAFGIKAKIEDGDSRTEIFIGMGEKQRLLKINGVETKKHAEISALFNCVGLTQEDIGIVKDSPEDRRLFLNQSFFLSDQNSSKTIRNFKKVLEQRNALLQSGLTDGENLKIWTEQFWNLNAGIQAWRASFIEKLQEKCNILMTKYLPGTELKISLAYRPKQDCTKEGFGDFQKSPNYQSVLQRESILKRSLFGAHLDDFSISIFNRCAKNFASRGEQKLVTLLLKYASIEILQENGQKISCVLIDDFLTDLDKTRMDRCQEIIFDFNIQTIITMPIVRPDLFEKNDKIEEIFLD